MLGTARFVVITKEGATEPFSLHSICVRNSWMCGSYICRSWQLCQHAQHIVLVATCHELRQRFTRGFSSWWWRSATGTISSRHDSEWFYCEKWCAGLVSAIQNTSQRFHVCLSMLLKGSVKVVYSSSSLIYQLLVQISRMETSQMRRLHKIHKGQVVRQATSKTCTYLMI